MKYKCRDANNKAYGAFLKNEDKYQIDYTQHSISALSEFYKLKYANDMDSVKWIESNRHHNTHNKTVKYTLLGGALHVLNFFLYIIKLFGFKITLQKFTAIKCIDVLFFLKPFILYTVLI